jgi:predicted RNase H-like HicB family nuclease
VTRIASGNGKNPFLPAMLFLMSFLQKGLVIVYHTRTRLVTAVKFGVVIEKDENGYYVVYVPELPSCHTQAKTLDKAMERIKEAIQAYLEAEGLKNRPRTELVGVQFVEVPAE